MTIKAKQLNLNSAIAKAVYINGNNISESLDQRPKLNNSQKGAKIQYGNLGIKSTPNTVTTFNVTFEEAFTNVPIVVLTPAHDSNGTSNCRIRTVNKSGFTGMMVSNGELTFLINWIAIGI